MTSYCNSGFLVLKPKVQTTINNDILLLLYYEEECIARKDFLKREIRCPSSRSSQQIPI